MTTLRTAAPQMRPRPTGHPGYTVGLACLPPSAALARQAVRTTVQCWGLPEDLADNAALIASELVTNAVQHTGPQDPDAPARCRLTIERIAPDTVRLEVADHHTRSPAKRTATEDDETGRGLVLVEALCVDWGTTPRPIGKAVWAELKADT
ncbi:ATP-binding protein [Streptomyces sp. NPDC057651]|uniref:ATP-binding protein n=1 Tax=Streptomyces sp. NPDC057651 TaxID=3346194 RepID=UPI0036C165D2